MQAVLPRLAGGSISAEVVADAAAASIFAVVCVLSESDGWKSDREEVTLGVP